MYDSSYMRFLEKAMAPHSSTLTWRIPWREEPGGLQSMGSQRVRHNWATSLSLFTFMHWRGKWQPTPVFLPGESWGRGSLVGCRLWGPTESDTTEQLNSENLRYPLQFGGTPGIVVYLVAQKFKDKSCGWSWWEKEREVSMEISSASTRS